MQQILLLGGVARAHCEHQKYSGSRHAESVTCQGFQLDCLGLCHLCDDRNGQAVVVFHLSSLLQKLSVSFTALQCASLSSVGDTAVRCNWTSLSLHLMREKVHLD